MTPNEGPVSVPFHDPLKVRRMRYLAGKNQAETARLAGITPAHLSNIEADQDPPKTNPSPEVLARIAEALGCTIADFERQIPTPLTESGQGGTFRAEAS